ncbi:MAG: amidohydrolase family protein [Solirubrobacterales bacterium]|nr:amidohydrolase family protein [Solirubrobacterales bacterium]
MEIFDAHTHIGANDPDGHSQTVDELLRALAEAHADGCFVFAMHEPNGYRKANDAVLAAARAHPDVLVPFVRVDPWSEPLAEAVRCLDLGARGIKLHPRAERFTLDHPSLADLFAVAGERRVPVLIHAGRGIAAPGAEIVKLVQRFPATRVILAHAGAADLSWIWRAARELPNLLFDSSWWYPADLRALYSLVPPGQILFASDVPYGHSALAAVCQARVALSAGLSEEQMALIFAGQARRIAAGEPLAVAGPAVGEREQAPHVLLDRIADMLSSAIAMAFREVDYSEPLTLAALACKLPEDHDDAPVAAAVAKLIGTATPDRAGIHQLMLAMTIARTPDVPLQRFGHIS